MKIGFGNRGFFMDDAMIKKNPNVYEELNWHRLFRTDYWGLEMFEGDWTHKSFRPLTVLTFRWNHAMVGSFAGSGFHIVNVLLNLVCSVLLGLFGFALGLSADFAVLLGALFLAHPVHTESVLYIVGRADLLCLLLVLVATLLYTPCAKESKFGSLGFFLLPLAALLMVAAGLCKETGFCFFGLLAGWEILRGFLAYRGCSVSRLLRFMAIILLGSLACGLRDSHRQHGPAQQSHCVASAQASNRSSNHWHGHFDLELRAHVQHLIPGGHHDWRTSAAHPLCRPSSHRGLLVFSCWRRGACLLWIACSLAIWRCAVRVPEWKSSESITTADGLTQRNSARVQFNLANVYLQAKQYDLALETYQRSINIDPTDHDALPLYHAGQILFFKGQHENAHRYLEKAVNGFFSPLTIKEEEIWHDYALSLWFVQKPEASVLHFPKALSINPLFTKAMNNMACAAGLGAITGTLTRDYYQLAINALDQAVRIEPGNVLYWRNAIALMTAGGDESRAAATWQQLVAMDPQGAMNPPRDCSWEFYFR